MSVTVTGTVNQNQDPPLHLAVRSGDVTKVRGVLLNSKMSINNIDYYYGRTPLELACQLGNIDIIKTLIDDTVQDDKGTIGDKLLKIALDYEKDEVVLLLITKLKCDPNIKGEYNRSPLHVACMSGNLSLVRTLIRDYHAYLNDKDSYGYTPFTLALKYEEDEVMLVLISEFGCDPTNIKYVLGVSPLHVACKKGNLSLVRTLIRDYHADLNNKDRFGETPFILALENERDEVMLVLISEFGHDPTNSKDINDVSPLHVACKKGNFSLIRTLIRDYHADLNDKNCFSKTPFIFALENERDEVVLVLISEFGCDPTNIKDRYGVSPLHVACKKGNLNLVRSLICDYHADLNNKDHFDKTPFILALENERDEVMLVLISEFGHDPTNSKDRNGVSPLHVACKKGNLSLVRTLIHDYHADINDKDHLGKTPFILALENERDEVMLVLISEFGHDPTNSKDRNGVSPLHVACKKGNLSLVRTLIHDYHADINDKDHLGKTPFILALENERDEVMLVLISEFGHDPTNSKDRNGVSPLHVACKKGNLSLVRTLICEYHADLNDRDIFGNTPITLAIENERNEVMLVLSSEFTTNIKSKIGVSLHVACKKGNLSLVRTLIHDYHADLNNKDSSGKTPFTLALEYERDEVMLVLINEFGCDPTNIKCRKGVSPLHVACKKGNLSLVRTLILDYHAGLNKKDSYGKTPFIKALENERDEVMLLLISEFRYDPTNIKGRNDASPLHIACKKGNLSLVRTLIHDYHADINDKDISGKTPFTLALENERDEVMLVLISEFRYDPTNIKGRNDVSPLHVACKKGNLSLVRTLIRDYHADINDKEFYGKTSFTLALENERDEVMLVLISEFRYDPTNIKGRNDVSPLHIACKKGNLSLVRTLIHDYHADINDKDISGKTPFTLALENERDEVVLVLISEFGCDPTNIKGRYGVSPLHIACKKGNLSLVRTLIHDYHADINDKDISGKTPFH